MTTLSEIYFQTGATRFRVRDIRTCEDIFIYDVTAWTQGRPNFFAGVKLEQRSFIRYTYAPHENVFALLSTREERAYWKTLTQSQAVHRSKFHYKQHKDDAQKPPGDLPAVISGHMFSG